MGSMLRSMSSRVRAPHTVVTRPTAMYGSMIAMAGEHRGAPDALSRSASGERRRRDPRLAADIRDAHRHLVDVAPRPVLARLERADDRVLLGARVRGRVTVGRAVAAADVAALEADPQVDPLAAAGEAVLASVDGLGQLEDFHVVEMGAVLGHRGSLRGLGERQRDAEAGAPRLGVDRQRPVVAVDDDALGGREAQAGP